MALPLSYYDRKIKVLELIGADLEKLAEYFKGNGFDLDFSFGELPDGAYGVLFLSFNSPYNKTYLYRNGNFEMYFKNEPAPKTVEEARKLYTHLFHFQASREKWFREVHLSAIPESVWNVTA